MCAFSLVVDRDLLKDTYIDGVKSRQQTCFSFFMLPKFFNKSFKFLLYKTNRLHFSMCVYCNRSQKTSQHVKNDSHATRLRVILFCSLHTVTSSVIYYSTQTPKNVIYLLNSSKAIRCSIVPVLHFVQCSRVYMCIEVKKCISM